VRATMLAARIVGYSTGPSGFYLMRLFEQRGSMKRSHRALFRHLPTFPWQALSRAGDVELGIQQLSELMHLPGIDVFGKLPSGIQAITIFSAGLCTASGKKEAVKTLLVYLAST
jgi:molybdate transport system substrate-binding protein